MKLGKKQKPVALESADLARFLEEERHLTEQIAQVEALLKSAPEKLRREYEESRNHMPPPDDWEDRIRAKRFNAHLSKGEIRNNQRYQTRSTSLFFLLLAAIIAITSWIVFYLQTVL